MARLEIGEIVGEGTFGQVRQVTYNGDYNNVMKSVQGPDWSSVMEIHISSCFDHPNLLRRKAMVSPGESHGFIKEGYIGIIYPKAIGDLYNITKGYKMSWPQRKKAVKDIACGLHALHSNKYCHFDLKQSNVLYFEDGRSVICDFSLCHHMPYGFIDKTSDQELITTDHRPPENLITSRHDYAAFDCAIPMELFTISTGEVGSINIRHDRYSYYSDIWSFAMTMIEILLCVPIHILHGNTKITQVGIARFHRQIMLYGERFFESYNIPANEIPALCSILRRMLSIHPTRRSTIDEILSDPFFQTIPIFLPTKTLPVVNSSGLADVIEKTINSYGIRISSLARQVLLRVPNPENWVSEAVNLGSSLCGMKPIISYENSHTRLFELIKLVDGVLIFA